MDLDGTAEQHLFFQSLYDGEQRDDTLPELPEEKAMFCESPKGALTERMSLPVKAHETFSRRYYSYASQDGSRYGAGICRHFTVRIKGGNMSRIRIWRSLAEQEFYNEKPAYRKNRNTYTSDGTEKDYSKFTYFGYRYVSA